MTERRGGGRGPAPKPTALKVLHGDFKKNPQRRNDREPIPAGDVAPPVQLSGPARKEWDYLLPVLQRAKMITPADVHMLAEFCETVIVVRMARVAVMRVATGQLEIAPGAANPYTSWSRAVHAMTDLGGRLGLSPSDRTRLQVEQPQEQDDLLSG